MRRASMAAAGMVVGKNRKGRNRGSTATYGSSCSSGRSAKSSEMSCSSEMSGISSEMSGGDSSHNGRSCISRDSSDVELQLGTIPPPPPTPPPSPPEEGEDATNEQRTSYLSVDSRESGVAGSHRRSQESGHRRSQATSLFSRYSSSFSVRRSSCMNSERRTENEEE